MSMAKKTANDEQAAKQAPEQERALNQASGNEQADTQPQGDEQVEKQEPEQEQVTKQAPEQEQVAKETVEAAIDQNVERLMRLYPQYKRLWITKNGFVHPEGVPKWMTKDARLYENKFHK